MKKNLAVFLLLLSLTVLMSVAVSADAPTEISSAAELMSMEMNGSYKLVADIDLTGVEFTPIGTDDAPFTGVFDGNSKKIKGLTFETAGEYIGLFGVCNGATVKNVVIDRLSVNVDDSSLSQMFVSGICAYTSGKCTFENITVNGSISVKSANDIHVAGICAYSSSVGGYTSSYTSCINNASITSKSTGSMSTVRSSGIVANGIGVFIDLCANNGDITVDAKCGAVAAGICAAYGQADLTKSYNSASISATSATVGAIAGGLAANVANSAVIEDSYNAGSISADGGDDSTAGGICAESMINNQYRRCYNAGAVTIVKGGSAGSLIATASARDKYSSNYVIESEIPIIAKNSKNGAATVLTSDQMKSADSFADFDFDTVWYMQEDGDYLYPLLNGFPVEEPAVLGDVNNDGAIDTLDVIIASRALADYVGYGDYVSAENCDLNSDGSVTAIDTVILARHIAAWTGYETIPFAE